MWPCCRRAFGQDFDKLSSTPAWTVQYLKFKCVIFLFFLKLTEAPPRHGLMTHAVVSLLKLLAAVYLLCALRSSLAHSTMWPQCFKAVWQDVFDSCHTWSGQTKYRKQIRLYIADWSIFKTWISLYPDLADRLNVLMMIFIFAALSI